MWSSSAPLPDEALASLYQDCAFFTLPSKKEGFGLVFLEAMARSRAVVACDAGGTPGSRRAEFDGIAASPLGTTSGSLDAFAELWNDPRQGRTTGGRGAAASRRAVPIQPLRSTHRDRPGSGTSRERDKAGRGLRVGFEVDMKAVILCGGQGTRIRDVSEALPKPMLPIGGKPIVWHIMKSYASSA